MEETRKMTDETIATSIKLINYHAKLRGLHKQLADAQWDGDDKRVAELVREITVIDALIANGERYEVNF